MIRGDYFPSVWPWNKRADDQLRTPQLDYQALNDPRQRLNQSELVRTSLISGRQGFDYSNPAAFAGTQYLKSPLIPAYGIRGDSPAGVIANIAATPPLRA